MTPLCITHLMAVFLLHSYIVFMCNPTFSVHYLYFLEFTLYYRLYDNAASVYFTFVFYIHSHIYSSVTLHFFVFCVVYTSHFERAL